MHVLKMQLPNVRAVQLWIPLYPIHLILIMQFAIAFECQFVRPRSPLKKSTLYLENLKQEFPMTNCLNPAIGT